MVPLHRSQRRRRDAGFALFGLFVALAIVAMGLSMMIVFADRVMDADRTESVVEEMEEIYRAIVGNGRDTFGYMGEIGAYPASLMDLVMDPGNAGWRGPYLRDPRIQSEMMLDPWGQPYEYWVVDGLATSDRLAIVSRGPDGQSTNTAADPNVRTNFTGTSPADAAYFTDARNADNVIFPRPDPSQADTLNVNTDSILAVDLNNFDSNIAVNSFVDACPNLFTITVQNTSRGTNDVPPTPYPQAGFQVTLPQGTYRVFIQSALLPQPVVNDRIVVFPVVPVHRIYNTTGVDSSGTDPYVLTFTNMYPMSTVTVYEFATSLGNVSPNATVNFTPKACSTIDVKISGTTVETFTMPLGNFSKIVGGSAASIAVTNDLSVTIQIYRDGLFIGDIKKNKSATFSSGLVAGNVIEAKRADDGVVVKTTTLVAGSQTMNVP